MEAARKISVAEKLDAFKARYPLDKYIWVNAPPETMDEWPEHYGLGAKTFKVPTENFLKYKSPKTGKESTQNGWLFELHGLYLLLKPAKLRIMQDAGIIPIPKSFRRLDDGKDPKVCAFEGAMGKLTISGLDIARGQKWIDLRLTTRVSQEYLIENCETKLELRLGWKLIALPQAFPLTELKAKEFVTFCVFKDFKARTPEEHMLILQHMLGIAQSAFPGMALPEGQTPKQLEAPKYETVTVDADEIEDIDEIEEDDAGAAPAPLTPRQETVPAAPAPAESETPKVNPDFIAVMQALKSELIDLLDLEHGDAEYHRILRAHGVEHSNEPLDRSVQIAIYTKVMQKVELLKKNLPKKAEKAVKGEESFIESLLKTRREGFERMAMERLAEHLDELSASCPAGKYPSNMIEIIQSGDKPKMIDLAVELVRINIEEAKRLREAQNAKEDERK